MYDTLEYAYNATLPNILSVYYTLQRA